MESSERKRQANAENARKSTGPRTAGGKNRSKYNAVKHGLFAKQILFSNEESRAEFEELLAGMQEEYQPRGPLEEHLVNQIATDIWKTRALDDLELRALVAKSHNSNSAAAVLKEARRCVQSAVDPPSAEPPSDEVFESNWHCDQMEISVSNRNIGMKPTLLDALDDLDGGKENKLFQVRAVLSDPVDKTMRYRTALARQVDRNVKLLDQLQRRRAGNTSAPPPKQDIATDSR